MSEANDAFEKTEGVATDLKAALKATKGIKGSSNPVTEYINRKHYDAFKEICVLSDSGDHDTVKAVFKTDDALRIFLTITANSNDDSKLLKLCEILNDDDFDDITVTGQGLYALYLIYGCDKCKDIVDERFDKLGDMLVARNGFDTLSRIYGEQSLKSMCHLPIINKEQRMKIISLNDRRILSGLGINNSDGYINSAPDADKTKLQGNIIA